jgi:hypothetical protein
MRKLICAELNENGNKIVKNCKCYAISVIFNFSLNCLSDALGLLSAANFS